MYRIFFTFFYYLVFVSLACAQTSLTELIDIPTAEQVDHYGYYVSFRLYSEGGLLTKAIFGVLPRLNIGFGIDTERFIGQRAVDLNRPTINLKIRFFDGQDYLPALALGYDDQGYFFDELTDKYLQREKGLYLATSNEIFVPDLELHGGINIYDFKRDVLHGFAGFSYTYENTLALLFELDNIRIKSGNRLNIGGRYWITPTLSVDIAGRDIGAASRKAERIVKINYMGSF